jgi:hypothetical protein
MGAVVVADRPCTGRRSRGNRVEEAPLGAARPVVLTSPRPPHSKAQGITRRSPSPLSQRVVSGPRPGPFTRLKRAQINSPQFLLGADPGGLRNESAVDPTPRSGGSP